MAQPSSAQNLPGELSGPNSEGIQGLKDRSWFIQDLEKLERDSRELFEKYSKIPSQDVVSHVTHFRDKAFEIYPYPCLGAWRFLQFSIQLSPAYGEILQRVKNGDKYLDLGCCVGQDIRKLVYDGAPSQNTYGADLRKEFMDIGYDLFLDEHTLKTTFVAADIFAADSDLNRLEGTMDIVHTASFFHLFDLDQQVQAAKRVAALIASRPGGLIVGRQIGNDNAGDIASTILDPNRSRFRHNPVSFAKLWKQVGDETGTHWTVDAKLGDEDLGERTNFKHNSISKGTRWLTFVVRKL